MRISPAILGLAAVVAALAIVFGVSRGNDAQAAPGNPNYKLDHDKCWTVESPNPVPQLALLSDQFDVIPGTTYIPSWEVVAVGRPEWFCNPAVKNLYQASGASGQNPTVFPIKNANDHLTCYEIKELVPAGTQPAPALQPHTVLVDNQFGKQVMTALNPRDLCVPSQKALLDGTKPPTGGAAPSTDLDHFKCYDVEGKQLILPLQAPPVSGLSIADQFDLYPTTQAHTEVVRSLTPVLLCNPTTKLHIITNIPFTSVASPVNILVQPKHPDQHLVCYRIDTPEAKQHILSVNNQFGAPQKFATLQSDLLCVPSNKCLATSTDGCSPTPTPTPTNTPTCIITVAGACIPCPVGPNCPPIPCTNPLTNLAICTPVPSVVPTCTCTIGDSEQRLLSYSQEAPAQAFLARREG